MKRHWKLWLALALLVACGGVGWIIVDPFAHEAERAYGRLRLGMTITEVEEAIGKPVGFREKGLVVLPRDYRLRRETGVRVFHSNLIWHAWCWSEYQIDVVYDDSSTNVGYYLYETPRLSLLDRLRRVIGL